MQFCFSLSSHCPRLLSWTPVRLWHDLHATSLTKVNASHTKIGPIVVQEPFSKTERLKSHQSEWFNWKEQGPTSDMTSAPKSERLSHQCEPGLFKVYKPQNCYARVLFFNMHNVLFLAIHSQIRIANRTRVQVTQSRTYLTDPEFENAKNLNRQI